MYAQAKALRDRLRAGGLKAYTDPDQAAGNRPCVLVTPPVIDWQRRSAVWQLAVLTAQSQGSPKAWEELDETLSDAQDALAGQIERATPTAYALTKALPAVPCYLATYTTSH